MPGGLVLFQNSLSLCEVIKLFVSSPCIQAHSGDTWCVRAVGSEAQQIGRPRLHGGCCCLSQMNYSSHNNRMRQSMREFIARIPDFTSMGAEHRIDICT